MVSGEGEEPCPRPLGDCAAVQRLFTHKGIFNMDFRLRCKKYQRIGKRLIKNDESLSHIRDSDVRIAYLSSDHEMKSGRKLVLGQCEKVPEKYKWAVRYDFTITIFEPNVERLTDKQLEIVILHELMHVGIEKDGNEEVYYINQHDVEDFRTIIDRYGLDWSLDEPT